MGKEWHPSSLTEPTGPRVRTTKRTVLRIVKAAEFTYIYCFTNLLSTMVTGKQNQTFDVLVITFWAVRYWTVIEMEVRVIVLKASRNTLMARNAREICILFAHLYLHNGLCTNRTNQ